jgi:hypothetical protein
MRIVALCGLILALAACSTQPATGDLSPEAGGSGDLTAGSETDIGDEVRIHFKDQIGVDLELSPGEIVPEDSGTGDGPALQCNPGEGCFGDECLGNSDCQSGWCVEHMGDGVCTQSCQDECPAGWSCQQVAGTEPDIVFICVSDYANLCKPCSVGSDCGSIGSQDVCVDYGTEGSFCGGSCEDDGGQCPWGFVCQEVTTVDGASSKQCITEAGVCPCTGKSILLSLSTPCIIDNEFGTCGGHRVCVEDGLSDCNALVPGPEECNGIDDNCSGVKDEGTCDDGVECTLDTCVPESGCVNEPLNSGECTDGNPCTAADHCEAGECAGAPVFCDDNNVCTDDLCDELGGCLFEPNQEECDDLNPCTIGDHCKETVCVGVDVECGCQSDPDCEPLDDGNLCNGTLVCEQTQLPFVCVVLEETVIDCPVMEGPDAICVSSVCQPQTGECVVEPDHEGFACDDGDACTVGEICVQGSCGNGMALNCNDGNPCSQDSCNSESGCEYENNTDPCQDGNQCTVGDSCLDGDCVGGNPMTCDDGNPCTNDSCEPTKGCLFEANQAVCNDYNPCTEGDHCEEGVCLPLKMLDCNDGNLCTDDICDAQKGCTYTMNSAPCDDLNECTINDKCKNGWCLGENSSCQDFNPCTNDSCTSELGCVYEPNDNLCNDGSLCTTGDHCKDGDCQGAVELNCEDDNICTDDICNPVVGCVHTLNQAPCDDLDPCTDGDQCNAGLCAPGLPKSCNDDVECTVDSCDGVCKFVPMDGACDDFNSCTEDKCDIALGCLHTLVNGPCEDGNPCTIGDSCEIGVCVSGQETDCDDQNSCTEDTCDPVAGCIQSPIVAQCDDNNPCTDGDECQLGECLGVQPVSCDDQIACTEDSCVPFVGCSYLPDDDFCDDGSVCTQNICTADSDCTSVPVEGLCEGGQCKNGECVLDCVPDCAAKECGTDGCDGSCGDCLAGYDCVSGICKETGNVECDDDNDILWDGCTAGKYSEFRINTFTPGDQTYPHVDGLPGGGYVVVWNSYDQDGSYYGIYGQRFQADGSVAGEEFQVNTYTNNQQSSSNVASLGEGRFMVVWQSSGQDGSGYGIYAQRFQADGSPFGSEFRINSKTSNEQREPSVAGQSDGTSYVSFQNYHDGSSWGIYGRGINSQGTVIGSDTIINTTTSNSQESPVLASHPNGYIAVWHSNNQDNSGWGVYGQRLNLDGSKAGSEFKVHIYTPSDQRFPRVSAAADGAFVAVWQSYNEDGSSNGVYCQRFSPVGAKLGNPFRVNTYIVSSQEDPDVAVWPDGRFVVVWVSHGQDSESGGIYGQMYNANGTPLGFEFRVNVYTAYNQYSPVVSTLDGAGFVVAWTSQAQDDSVSGVFAQRYDAAGNKLYH